MFDLEHRSTERTTKDMKKLSPRVLGGVVAASLLALVGVTAATAAVTSGPASNYNPMPSTRVLDTRTTHTPLAAGATATVSLGTVPADATAVTVNVTVTAPTGGGYVLAYADGAARPNPGSTVNFSTGQTVANQTTVQLSDGKIDVYNGSTGTVQVIVDVEGYFSAAPAAYTPPQTSWTATSTVSDHADSGNGGTWAIDTITRTASINLKGAASVWHCGSGATSCYLYEGTISDTGSFTTASSSDVTTDGKSPNAGATMNGTVVGSLTGGSAIQFYASSDAPSAALVPATVTGPVSGEQTTFNWVEQFFTGGTTFGSGPSLLNWVWTYSAPATCEQWVDGYKGETGDIAGVNACKA